jgi:hypothetical protein
MPNAVFRKLPNIGDEPYHKMDTCDIKFDGAPSVYPSLERAFALMLKYAIKKLITVNGVKPKDSDITKDPLYVKNITEFNDQPNLFIRELVFFDVKQQF